MRKRMTFLVALALISGMLLHAQGNMEPLPTDSNVRVGHLENGLTYYIRHNEQPKERCEFHIAQGVGAILEHDDQNGLAHFLEHMAFNGTKHFDGKGIINYFQSIGVNFGGNINAYTSLDETVYRLSDVPTIREGIIDSALLVLYDWSCALSLKDEEIDAERGVIREEWRTGATANRRMWKESNKQKYAGSQYAIRDVIGDTAVINNFAYDALRRYYKQWYGPDLQAIIIVGDIDVNQIEAKVKKLFGSIPARTNRGERPIYDLKDNREPIVSIVTDPEAQYSRIDLEYKHPVLPREARLSVQGYFKDICDQLIAKIMEERFTEMKTKPNTAFMHAAVSYDNLVKSSDAFNAISIAKKDKEQEAYRELLTEVFRMQRYGFTISEVERAKTDILKLYETSYNERNNTRNINFTREYIRNYLDAEPIPGIAWEYNFAQKVLPAINAELLGALAKSYVTDTNLIIAFQGPTSAAGNFPSKADAVRIYKEVEQSQIEAPKEEKIDRPLVENEPKKPGKIKKVTKNSQLGTTEWLLNNGVRVVFKPTTFKQDEILMSGYSMGGTSTIKNVADLPSAELATTVVSLSGLGTFSALELQKILTGKIADVSASLNTFTETFDGNSSVADFETMLQLLYLHFTATRMDKEACDAFMSSARSALANRDANPKSVWSDSINMVITCHSPRTQIENLAWLDRINIDKSLEIFRQRFNNPADFLFTFTGNINPENAATKQAILKWIGGMKTLKTREQFTDNGVRTPQGIVKNYFKREMNTHTASNFIYYTGRMDYNLANKLNMEAIGEILGQRYLESIREREGGSYGVGTAGRIAKYPLQTASLIMNFDTDPEKQAKLINIIHQEIEEILKNGPRADDLQKVKESMLKDFNEDIEKNSYWNDAVLYRYYIDGMDYTTEYKKAVEAITSETIVKTLKTLIDQKNVAEIVMLPTE